MNTDQITPTPTPRTDAAELDGREFYRGSSGPSGYCAADFARDLERQLAELTDRWERAANAYMIEQGKHEETQRQLAAERALADRLAHCIDDLQYAYNPMEAKRAFTAWKEARGA